MQKDLAYSPNRTRLLNALTAAALISMILTFVLALFYVVPDANQGPVQRLFYVHLGAFTGGTTAFFITVLAADAHLSAPQTEDADPVPANAPNDAALNALLLSGHTGS